MITTPVSFQDKSQQTKNEVFAAFFLRFHAGGFA